MPNLEALGTAIMHPNSGDESPHGTPLTPSPRTQRLCATRTGPPLPSSAFLVKFPVVKNLP